MLTPRDVRAVLAEHGLHPRKALGQHFLADPNTARRITRLAGVRSGDRVLEIGPGIGSLTLALLDAGCEVVALELDRYLVPALESVVAGRGGGPLRVVEGDALTVDLVDLLGPGPWSVVANLPYNVATPVVVRVLEEVPAVTRILVMVQREVGERLAAGPGDRAHGAVSVKVAYHAEARVVGVVPPTVFLPRPRVDSALILLERRLAPPVDVPDPERMFRLVRAGFAQRRKTLRRSLAAAVDDPGALLARAGVDAGARAEVLTLDDWSRLARAELHGPSVAHDPTRPVEPTRPVDPTRSGDPR